MLIVMCRKIESVTVFRIIKSIDPEALVTQANVNGVYGKGFDQIKVKMKNEPQRNEIDSANLHAKIEAETKTDFAGGHASRHIYADEQTTHSGQPSSRI